MRLANWPTLLAEFLTERGTQEHVWGKNDCCLFAADAIEVITGVDNASEFRGRYTTELGAKRALLRYGAGDIRSTFTAKFGQPVARLKAVRGDIALVIIDGVERVGVVYGKIYLVSDKGLVTLPLNQSVSIWSIN
tara:strand:- start:749 stop:1153 length:405 start_codon:yes stop_codon:yes gene_type:complete